jgi:hypothetical protein
MGVGGSRDGAGLQTVSIQASLISANRNFNVSIQVFLRHSTLYANTDEFNGKRIRFGC